MIEFQKISLAFQKTVCASFLIFASALSVSVAQQKAQNSIKNSADKKPSASATKKNDAKLTTEKSNDVKTSQKPAAQTNEPRFIVTNFKVNLRETASAGAREIGELSVGTLVRGLERSEEKQTIGNKTDYWLHVETVGGAKQNGWAFGAFLQPFDAAKRELIYRELTTERFKAAGKSFSDNVELFRFLTRILPEVKTPSVAAELSLNRLLTLKKALAAIPFDKQSNDPYKTFTDEQKANIVYSDPSGEWYVISNLFWNLARKYKNLPIAEKIAWEAANNPLPGECEGYLNCYLYLLNATHGAYLEQFPRGSYAAESVKIIGEGLQPIAEDARKKQVYTAPSEASEKADFYRTIADLRVRVSKTGLFEKDAVLRQLNQIAEGYK